MEPLPEITIDEICPAVRDQLIGLERTWNSKGYTELIQELGEIYRQFGGEIMVFCQLAAQIIFPYKDPVQAVTTLRMMVETSTLRRAEIEAELSLPLVAKVSRNEVRAVVAPAGTPQVARRKPETGSKAPIAQTRKAVKRGVTKRFPSGPKKKPGPKLRVNHTTPDSVGRGRTKKKPKTEKPEAEGGQIILSVDEADKLMGSLSQKWQGAALGQKVRDMKQIADYARGDFGKDADQIARMVQYFSGLPLGDILPFVQIAVRLDQKDLKYFKYGLADDLSLEVFVEHFCKVNSEFERFIMRISRSAKRTERRLTLKGLVSAYRFVMI